MGRNFWRYFVAQAVSSIGSIVGRLALSFLVYDLTESAWAMGALLLVSSIPEIIVRLLGAPLIDRFPRLKLMAFLDIVRFTTYLVAWICFTTGQSAVWVFFLQAFIAGTTGALYSPAAMAIIPSLVPAEKLVKANGLNQTVMNALWVLGPMIAVTLCAFLGNANAVLLDGLTFGLCGLVLATIPMKKEAPVVAMRKGTSGYAADLVEGFAIYRRIPALLSITAVLAISNIGSFGSTAMLVPYVREYLGAPNTLVGWIDAGLAAGALIGSLILTSFTLRVRKRYLMLGGLLLIQGAQLIGAFMSPRYAILLIPAWALWGLGLNLYSINSHTIYQQLVPDHLRGRAMSVRMLVGYGVQPIGQFLGAWIAVKWNPSITFLVGGGIPFLITIGALFLPSIQGLDRLDLRPADADADSPPAKQGAPAIAANSSQ
ncbi:MAG TPA: MFS transporter [Symbiobacteriaceae bacterium]|nr:MFS transporter [Symbiobacteriaceae bacterium]